VISADTPLGAAFSELAAEDPDAPAVTVGETTVARGALDEQANALAQVYCENGVCPDDFVSIALPNGIAFYVAVLAAWKVGAIPQPLSPKLPAMERDTILTLVDPALVVGLEPSELPNRPSLPASSFAGLDSAPSEALPPAAAASFKAVCSGGSTGRPKLIVADQPAVVGSLLPLAQLLHIAERDTLLITGPLYHNGPFTTSLCGLVLGGHLVVMERFDPQEALTLVDRHRVTWMYAVPTMMSRIWKLPKDFRDGPDVSSLRVVMHMAAPCPGWLKRAWIDWLGPSRILELYTATEVQAATVVTGEEWLARPGTVGKAVVGEIQILGDDGQALPPGVEGEVWMRRGPGLVAPYHYVGAEPRQRDGGWESVGDTGRLDDDGYLYLADRTMDKILVGGANVYPAEVEAAILRHPAVRSAVVIGLPHRDLGQVPHALVELESEVSDEDLLEVLRSQLVSYKLPRTFERVSEPLRDEAGKVRRSGLAEGRIAMQG
jgi:bile acid-coenzyme A ligase